MLKKIEKLEAELAELKAEYSKIVLKPEFEAFEVYHKDLEGRYTWSEAKKACEALGEGWRLPTKEELNEMYKKRDVVGGFANSGYWSSTGSDNGSAWLQYFYGGGQYGDYKSNYFFVRAVRALTI